ncbi:MAG: hypothetical protein RIQ89_2279 [Bacteroidota bacterium]|jgi:hypothetical protein
MRYFKLYLTLLTFILLAKIQTSAIGFSKQFDNGNGWDVSGSSRCNIVSLPDSGYVVCFNVADTSGGSNVHLVKLDIAGTKEWEKTILIPTNIELAHDAVIIADSFIYIQCTYDEPGFIYDEEVMFIKTDLNGNLITSQDITNSGICCWDISDGRLAIGINDHLLFTHRSFGISTIDGIVRVYNKDFGSINGATDNTFLYHSNFFQDADSSYYSFGHEYLQTQKRAGLTKRNKLFGFVWQKYFRHPAMAFNQQMLAHDLIKTSNGFYLLMSFADSANGHATYLLQTDTNGDSLSSATWYNTGYPFGICINDQNQIILAATSNDSLAAITLTKIDNNFQILANRKFQLQQRSEHVLAFKKSNDHHYLITATADSLNERNIHALKIDDNFCVPPSASFRAVVNTGLGPDTASVIIKNTSDYGILDSNTTVTINFGDGSLPATMTTDSILHIYAVQGTYTVTLTVNTICGTSSYSNLVVVPCTGFASSYNYTTSLLSINLNYSGGGTSYSWTLGDGATANTASVNHNYANDGTYLVCLTTDNGCGPITICDSISVACTAPVVSLPDTVLGCIGYSINLNAGPNGSSYLWNTGATASTLSANSNGNYTVSVTNICGNTTIDSSFVAFSALPQLNIGLDTVICANDLILMGNYLTGGNYDYTWYINNQFQGIGPSFYFIQSWIANYKLTMIANNNGCIDSASRSVYVAPDRYCDTVSYCIPTYNTGTTQGDYVKRVAIGTINNVTGGVGAASYIDYSNLSTTVNAGQSINLTLEFNEVNDLYYRVWLDYNQDGLFSPSEVLTQNAVNTGIVLLSTSISNMAYGGPTRMRVRCASHTNTNIDPCSSYDFGQTEDYTIIINNGTGAPTPRFIASNDSIYPGSSINFTDQSYNNPTAWQWNFDGGNPSTSNQQNPQGINYPIPGCYTVRFKATNANGFNIIEDSCLIYVDLSLHTIQANLNYLTTIAPNPVLKFATITNVVDFDLIKIISTVGSSVSMEVPLSKTTIVDLEKLASGVYQIQLYHQNKLVGGNRLVKVK